MTEQERDAKWYWLDQCKMSVLSDQPLVKADLMRLIESLESAWLEIEESPCG